MIDKEAVDNLRVDILDGKIKNRKKCAIEYAAIIRAAQMSGTDVDVSMLNDAIVIRWSYSGLNFIKNKAWSIAAPPRAEGERNKI